MAGETEKFQVITSHRPLFAGPELVLSLRTAA